MHIGFHTDAFNSASWGFEKCLNWAQEHDVHFIEYGLIDGVSWIRGLGEQTGIAVSHCAIGDGVNAENIRRVLAILRDRGYSGVLSMECEGAGGPMIERSLAWLRATLADLGIREGAAAAPAAGTS